MTSNHSDGPDKNPVVPDGEEEHWPPEGQAKEVRDTEVRDTEVRDTEVRDLVSDSGQGEAIPDPETLESPESPESPEEAETQSAQSPEMAEVMPTEPSASPLAAESLSAADRSPQTPLDPGSAPSTDPNNDPGNGVHRSLQSKGRQILGQTLLLLSAGIRWGKKGVRWLRSQLSPAWQRRLSEEALAALLLGVLVVLLVLWNSLGSGRSTTTVAVPKGDGAVMPSEPSTMVTADGGDSPAVADDLTPPAPSPDQTMIADIQAQVSDLSRAYAAGLIQSVQVNLADSALVVNINESWYGLLPTQQDTVAQDIYDRAQGLDLANLQLCDPDGTVVARNPVVGNQMIILRRHRPGEADLLAT